MFMAGLGCLRQPRCCAGLRRARRCSTRHTSFRPRRSDDLGCGPGHDRHHIAGEPREQAKAIGVFSFAASASGSVGLLAGGMLTQAINWHRIFFINVPIGVATVLLALRLLKKDTGIGFGEGADVPGAVQITGSLMLGVYTIVESADDYGWGVGPTLGLETISLVLLAAFVVREATAPNPLIPLRIFRSRNLSGANVIQALTVVGMFGMIFLGVLYLQRVLGYDALETSLAFLPTTILIRTLSVRCSERLIMRLGARRTLLPGLVLIAAGLAQIWEGR